MDVNVLIDEDIGLFMFLMSKDETIERRAAAREVLAISKSEIISNLSYNFRGFEIDNLKSERRIASVKEAFVSVYSAEMIEKFARFFLMNIANALAVIEISNREKDIRVHHEPCRFGADLSMLVAKLTVLRLRYPHSFAGSEKLFHACKMAIICFKSECVNDRLSSAYKDLTEAFAWRDVYGSHHDFEAIECAIKRASDIFVSLSADAGLFLKCIEEWRDYVAVRRLGCGCHGCTR